MSKPTYPSLLSFLSRLRPSSASALGLILVSALMLVGSSAEATIDPCVRITKKVSVDGGQTFFDANRLSNAPATAGPEVTYKLIVKNCGDVELQDVHINDDVVGVYEWIASLAPGHREVFIIEDFPICEHPEPPEKKNVAFVWAVFDVDGYWGEVDDKDPAWVICTDEPFCGDHVVEAPETCDPPGQPADHPNECRDDCTFCGDGHVDPVEECDDGNNEDGDGCSAECVTENVCGDGHIQPPETCDPPGSVPDTPPGNENECRDNCTYCGDGIVNNGEECDDPNDPACTDDCMIVPPFCGDGMVDPELDETCDPPGSVPNLPPGNENECRDNCTYCGDGIVNNGEECDDPDDPFCSNECKLIPFCGDGMVDPELDETCDPPGSVPNLPPGNTNECRDNCTYCGDGIVNNGEECDDPDDPFCSNDCMLICGLEVVKTCELPPPPAPPEGKCEGKLQEYTVIWDGSVPIDISLGDGLTGLMTGGFSGMDATVQPGEEVTFFTDGSTNDTIVIIDGVGASTFHVSCSDKDMDGDTTTNEDQQQVSSFGRDCGKDQGDGKGDSGINTWLLEGFVDDDGAVLDCTTGNGAGDTVCEFNAIPADCDNPDKPENLTFLYSGGGCAASDNDQDSGDLFCEEFSGGVDPNLAVMLTDDDGNVFEVEPGGVFTTTRSDSKTFTLVNAGGTEENGRHVSCSQPLQAGDVYGSLTLVGLDGLGIGTPVTYSYEVTNGGNAEVTGIMVTDDQLGDIGMIASLQPGQSETLTADAFISETTTNVATVDGDGTPGAECLADSDPVTVDVLPPPPCDVGIAFYKLEDDKIKWKLTNNSVFGKATLQMFTLDFPAGFDVIKKVKLDGDIYKADDSNLVVGPGVTIGEDDWTKDDVTKRELDQGETRTLEVEFEEKDKTASPSDFDLFLTFEEGCIVTF